MKQEEEHEDDTPELSPQAPPAPTPKLTVLTEQNILLLHRVATLESTVRELKREMESVRAVLGPWLRGAEIGAGSRVNHANQSPGSRQLQHPEPSASGADEPSSAPTSSSSQEHAVSGDAATDAFASYFPDLDDVRMRGERPSGEHNINFNRSYSNTGADAPSSSSRTLESTLADMETAGGRTDLALASLEAAARRNEMAISNVVNDSLRMGEEMVGLRAGMYGLRMQMCGVLMERDRMMRGAPLLHPATEEVSTVPVHRFGTITKL